MSILWDSGLDGEIMTAKFVLIKIPDQYTIRVGRSTELFRLNIMSMALSRNYDGEASVIIALSGPVGFNDPEGTFLRGDSVSFSKESGWTLFVRPDVGDPRNVPVQILMF